MVFDHITQLVLYEIVIVVGCVSISEHLAAQRSTLRIKYCYFNGVHEWEKLLCPQNSFFTVFFGTTGEDNVTDRFRPHISGLRWTIFSNRTNNKFPFD